MAVPEADFYREEHPPGVSLPNAAHILILDPLALALVEGQIDTDPASSCSPTPGLPVPLQEKGGLHSS